MIVLSVLAAWLTCTLLATGYLAFYSIRANRLDRLRTEANWHLSPLIQHEDRG